MKNLNFSNKFEHFKKKTETEKISARYKAHKMVFKT